MTFSGAEAFLVSTQDCCLRQKGFVEFSYTHGVRVREPVKKVENSTLNEGGQDPDRVIFHTFIK